MEGDLSPGKQACIRRWQQIEEAAREVSEAFSSHTSLLHREHEAMQKLRELLYGKKP